MTERTHLCEPFSDGASLASSCFWSWSSGSLWSWPVRSRLSYRDARVTPISIDGGEVGEGIDEVVVAKTIRDACWVADVGRHTARCKHEKPVAEIKTVE